MSVGLVSGHSGSVFNFNSRLSFPSLFELINLRYPIEDVKSFIESIPVLDRFNFINQLDPTDPYGRTYLHVAAEGGNQELVELLLELGAEINAKSGNGQNTSLKIAEMTALHIAALRGHTGIVALLLARGADREARTKENYTPLHLAATLEKPECVQQLLIGGAAIHARNGIYQNTALHMAAFNGNAKAVAVLLQHGALMFERNADGVIPFEMAFLSRNRATVDLFFQRLMEKLNSSDHWSLLRELQEEKGLTYLMHFDAYLSLFSYVLRLNLVGQQMNPIGRDLIGEFTLNMEKVINFLLFDTRLCSEIDALITVGEQELKLIGQGGGDLESLIKTLSEFRQLLTLRLSPNITELLRALFMPHMIPVMRSRMQLQEAPQRLEALLQECVKLKDKRELQQRGFSEAEGIFDAEEIFSLLSSFGGGVGGGEMAPQESYPNLFGCQMEDLFKGRFFSGKDLRAIGVDLYLYHLCEYDMDKDTLGTIAGLGKVISEKIEFLEELEKMGHTDPKLSDVIRELKNYRVELGPQVKEGLHKLEFTIGKMLLRIFFSQGVENIQSYLNAFEQDKSLSDIKASAHLSILDFFRIGQEVGKRRSGALLIEPSSKNARSE